MNKLRMKAKTTEAGFTLIELIVVIVILGVLAATALPKFADLGGDARVAKMQAAAGAMKSSAAIFHAQWLVNGSPANGSTTVIALEGATVSYTNGYPDAPGMIVAAGNLADYVPVTATTVLTVTPDATHTACKVTYTAAAAGSAPVVDASAAIAANCK